MKRRVAAQEENVADVVLSCPFEAESMAILELLMSQRRWGRTRSRRVLVGLNIPENKRIGTLTDRQRTVLARELGSAGSRDAPRQAAPVLATAG